MFCMPFLGTESLLLESRSRFYGGLEVMALISVPTSKFDVGRLASNRQFNHILSIQQESLGSPSWVAGMCHGGAKAPVAEQAFKAPVAEQTSSGSQPLTKTLGVVKQYHKVPKVEFLTGSKPSPQSSSRVKPPIRNFEEQLAVLERIQLQSQMPCKGSDLSEEAQETHKFDISTAQQKGNHHVAVRYESINQAVNSRHLSFHQSVESQCSGASPSASYVDYRRAGLMRTELVVEAIFTGHDPVWNEPFSGVHGVWLSKNHNVGPPLGGSKQVLHQLGNSGINGSYHQNETDGFEGNAERDEAQRNAHQTSACQEGRQLHNSIQLDKEDSCTRNKNLLNGFRKGYGIESSNVGEPAFTTTTLEGMQTKESVNVSSAFRKVACIRMPVYRTSTPLRRSLSDTIFYLESLGADCSRLFRDDPTAMTCTVRQLRALVCALERLGLKSNDFGRIFNLCPKVLHLKPDGLKAVTSFLFIEAGLTRKDFGKVIRRCPRLLVIDIHEQLRPTLSFLRNLGYSNMGQVISNNPTLLSFSVEKKLVPKLRFLESLGFTYREAASMVVRFPAIFNYSISDNLQPKYDYLVHEMGGRNKDLLAFPQYFGYSLETRIRPRHECVAKLDFSLSIQAILKLSDAEFDARFLPGGGHNHPPKVLSVSPETSHSMLQDCVLDSVKCVSFEHPEVRVLVKV